MDEFLDNTSRNTKSQLGDLEATFPLGPQESFMHHTYEAFDGDGTVGVIVRLRGCIEEALLRRALSRLQQRHPKLRSRIAVNAQGEYIFEVFKSMNEIPLIVKEYETDELPWSSEAIETSMAKFISPTEPKCRVVVLRSKFHSICDLIIAMPHAYADGVSAFRIIEDILTFYDSFSRDKDTKPISPDRIAPLPFVSSSQLPISASLIDRIIILARLLRGQIQKRRGAWSALPQDPSGPPTWCRYVLSAEETNALVRRCRKEHTTLYGALLAAVLRSLSKAIREPKARFRIGCPLSIRHLQKPRVSNEHIGCFISLFENVYSVDLTTPFWELARRGRLDLKRFVNRQGPALAVNLMQFLKVSAKKIPPQRGTLGLNLSVAPLRENYGNLTIEELSFLGRNRIVGTSLNLFAIKFAGRLNMTIGTVELFEAFRETFLQTLLSEVRSAID